MTIQEVFENTSWSLLRGQKLWLITEAMANPGTPEADICDGLVSYIDAIQDCAEGMGFKPFLEGVDLGDA